ncbi:putative sulfate exporter family transporter [Horticoccus luteus]|uniref:Sulfate exporter family transporter n=1 Tax=Horticoccus luteus TaxID=2862869 RepID=A0A8F9TUI2_9BACT|nr:putative sulfate exporter family transporter [Horticoccus luteus]QYM78246.1 putative sulfate exporter family transporter [Horticoccus luteus]
MKSLLRQYLPALALTALLAGVAWWADEWPGVRHLGPLATALLLGLLWRAVHRPPAHWETGIGFVAKRLLRWGIILLGVRLNLALVVEAGPHILLIDLTVIVVGLSWISWLGRRFGLDPVLAMLIAVDSSICGGSATMAAAPVLRAKDHEVALVIPLCSLLGTGLMLGYTLLQHAHPVSAPHYGMMVGSTLHEVAQVVAAVTPFPDTIEIGMVAKLTRVVFLVPVVAVLGWIFTRRRAQAGEAKGAVAQKTPKPWFVLGFLLVGIGNTLALHFFPVERAGIASLDGAVLNGAAFLMAMAMAAMGLQTDFARLRENGPRAFGTAILGWAGVATLAGLEIWLLG